MFNCAACDNKYENYCSLKRHVRQKHSQKLIPQKTFKCCECNKQFNNKQCLSRHERTQHNITYIRSNQIYKCTYCKYQHYSKNTILGHLKICHNLTITPEDKQFETEDIFLRWKHEEESLGNCKFVATGGNHKNQTTRSQTFVCHRSQYFISKGNSKRSLKTQGSSKLNSFCPAEIKYTENNGMYCVKYVKTHTHQPELEHIWLTTEERLEIARKIVSGISFNTILDQIRDSLYEGEPLKRKHLLTRKDILNIEQCFNLRGKHQRHENDAFSVDIWIREDSENGSTPSVLFYKPQGELSLDVPELNANDFVLIIMNEAQSEILKKFGTDTLCIDGTHGLNQYDFQLVTLMVLDEFRQGFPCTFLISNRCDSLIARLLFIKVKERVGEIFAENFMSDMDQAFFNGYKAVMPMPKRRLYCSWHVDHAWRKNLVKVRTKEKQGDVYKILRILLEETDVNSFYALFTEAKTQFLTDEDTKDFGIYFVQNYESCVESWAYCFRLHSKINTNMHLERMHRTIKEIYCHKKKVKRLDNLLFILHKFVRDRLYDKLIIRHKGKITSKIKMLRERHKASLKLDPTIITEYDSGWLCPSSQNSEAYFIQKDSHFEHCDCHLRCSECGYCIHHFICSCIDNAIQWNMCKHIHLLCRSALITVNNKNNHHSLNLSSYNLEENALESSILTEISKKKLEHEETTLQEERCRVLEIFKGIICNAGLEELHYVKGQGKAIATTVSAMRESKNISLKNSNVDEEIKRRKEPANKNMESQRRLFSTKKKSKKQKEIGKPTSKEKLDISLNLLLK